MKVQKSDHVQMSLPAKPEYVGVVRLTVSGIANRLGFSIDEIEDLKLAVAEACTNVVTHAYEGERLIGLSFYLYDNKLEIVVSDRGQSFDLNRMRDRLGPINSNEPIANLKEGGLGLFLIDTLMDKVEIHNDSGVVLVMTKFLQRDEVKQHAEGVSSIQTEQPTDL